MDNVAPPLRAARAGLKPGASSFYISRPKRSMDVDEQPRVAVPQVAQALLPVHPASYAKMEKLQMPGSTGCGKTHELQRSGDFTSP
jgi:hypothetical protein